MNQLGENYFIINYEEINETVIKTPHFEYGIHDLAGVNFWLYKQNKTI